MKQLKLIQGLIAFILVFIECRMPSAQAQTVEPSTTVEACQIEDTVIWSVKFSPDGHYLAANWPEHSIRVWNTQTGATVSTLTEEHIDSLEHFVFSPDNKLMVTGGHSGMVMLWNVVSGKKIRTFERDTNTPEPQKSGVPIQNFAFSPDGKYIAVLDEIVGSLWNVDTGTKQLEFPTTHNGEPDTQFSQDGKTLMIEDRVWDTQSGQLLHEFSSTNNVRFSPNGNYILGIEFPSQDIILIDVKTYQTLHTLPTLNASTSDWQFSPNGKYLMALQQPVGDTGAALTALVWDVEKGKLLHEFPSGILLGYLPSIGFINNESFLLVKNTSEIPQPQTVFGIYDIKTGAEVQELVIDIGYLQMSSLAISPDGKYLAIGTEHPAKVTLWGIETGKPIQVDC